MQFECEQLIRPLLRRNIISISPSIVLYSILNLEQYLDLWSIKILAIFNHLSCYVLWKSNTYNEDTLYLRRSKSSNSSLKAAMLRKSQKVRGDNHDFLKSIFQRKKVEGNQNARTRRRPGFCQQSFRPVASIRSRPGCESIYITHTDSIYRSYNVFGAGVPFVSAVRALIIPRTFLFAPFFPPPREPKWPLVLERVHAASQVAEASDSIAVACLDNKG